jgi:hypothetical protein
MSKDNKAQTINIDGKEYSPADLTEEQVTLTNHCLDLDRKISNMNFQLQQLQVGKDSFFKMLKESLASTEEE